MKKSIFLIISMFLVISCSTNLVDVPKHKTDYVNSAIMCDAKTTKYTILNQEELADYLGSDEHGSFWFKYEINKTKEKRGISISRLKVNNTSHYSVNFKRKTFPFSDCRKIKTETKYLK